jgi:8-oxo-dGTP pyrophosphatase MutT (NUDIX family)
MDMKTTDFPRGIEVVTGVLIRRKDGKLLLTKSPNWANKWGLCGGHVEPGETIFAAAEREALEETGLKVKASSILRVLELINPADFKRNAHLVVLHIIADTTQIDPKIDNNEITDYAWVTPEEALTYDLGSSYADTFTLYSNSL